MNPDMIPFYIYTVIGFVIAMFVEIGLHFKSMIPSNSITRRWYYNVFAVYLFWPICLVLIIKDKFKKAEVDTDSSSYNAVEEMVSTLCNELDFFWKWDISNAVILKHVDSGVKIYDTTEDFTKICNSDIKLTGSQKKRLYKKCEKLRKEVEARQLKAVSEKQAREITKRLNNGRFTHPLE